MKYFTRDELQDITNKLIDNPTRETLKVLNDTYNGNSVMEQGLVNDNLVVNTASAIDNLSELSVPMKNEVLPSEDLSAQVVMPVQEVVEIPVVNTLSNINIPNIEVESIDGNVNNGVAVPGFELPKLETPVFNNQNNEQVNFSGNIYEQPMQNMIDLMQTTDNFNGIPNTEVSVAPTPFFGLSNEPVNNPIPIEGTINNMQNAGPSMFGEIQQNYM